jgi:hypothetical protein
LNKVVTGRPRWLQSSAAGVKIPVSQSSKTEMLQQVCDMKRNVWLVIGLVTGIYFGGVPNAAVGQDRQVIRLWEGVAPGAPSPLLEPKNTERHNVSLPGTHRRLC